VTPTLAVYPELHLLSRKVVYIDLFGRPPIERWSVAEPSAALRKNPSLLLVHPMAVVATVIVRHCGFGAAVIERASGRP
jgi:hypothetical protein